MKPFIPTIFALVGFALCSAFGPLWLSHVSAGGVGLALGVLLVHELAVHAINVHKTATTMLSSMVEDAEKRRKNPCPCCGGTGVEKEAS